MTKWNLLADMVIFMLIILFQKNFEFEIYVSKLSIIIEWSLSVHWSAQMAVSQMATVISTNRIIVG